MCPLEEAAPLVIPGWTAVLGIPARHMAVCPYAVVEAGATRCWGLHCSRDDLECSPGWCSSYHGPGALSGVPLPVCLCRVHHHGAGMDPCSPFLPREVSGFLNLLGYAPGGTHLPCLFPLLI